MTALPPAEIVIYQWADGSLELKGDLDWETIWANRTQMAKIFGVLPQAISKHIKNIYQEWELTREATSSKMELVQEESWRLIKRKVDYYNLEIMISVWYRINSLTWTKFRQRATQTLKQHITQWFTINHKKIQHNYETFARVVEDIKRLNADKVLPADDVLELIHAFGKTWFSLDAFDKQGQFVSPQNISDIKIEAKKLYAALAVLKQELIKKWEATELFGQEKEQATLEGIFANVFQTAFGEDVYPSIESKATHLLYFIVKNHPFNDGNKRSGAFAFIRFLKQTGHAMTGITPEALTALTLLVASSDPKEKEKVISLIMLLLQPL